MSNVKVGDKIKIIQLDWSSETIFPQFAGTVQTVVGVDEDGDPQFATTAAKVTGRLWVQQNAGGVFEIVN